jgi:hypothetical protein
MISATASMSRSNDEAPAEGRSIDLPGPRIWEPRDLSRFLGLSVHWVYKRTERSAKDPIPRIRGVGRLRFDTHSVEFQEWLLRQLGSVDRVEDDA